MQWPEFGGYLDFVADDRNSLYVRFYVGQSITVVLRIDTHCRHILQGAFDTLHYFILKMGDGHRRANWLQLWGMPKEMQYMETFSGFSISIIQCCLEMMFCRAFESLPDQTLAEYFGNHFASHCGPRRDLGVQRTRKARPMLRPRRFQ
jgi:hypothetical protein